MCDRSSDPTEHDAARERPSALDEERLAQALVAIRELVDEAMVGRLLAGKRSLPARLAEQSVSSSADWRPTPDTTEATLRKALESVIRLAEPIPHSHDVEQAGIQAEVVIETARAALQPSTPDTTEATLRALLDGGPCFYCRHGDRAHHTSAFPRWCGECHCRAYAPTGDEYLQALVGLRRAALQQPAVQPEYRCGVCGSGDRVEHNDEMHAQEARAVQPEGGPE